MVVRTISIEAFASVEKQIRDYLATVAGITVMPGLQDEEPEKDLIIAEDGTDLTDFNMGLELTDKRYCMFQWGCPKNPVLLESVRDRIQEIIKEIVKVDLNCDSF